MEIVQIKFILSCIKITKNKPHMDFEQGHFICGMWYLAWTCINHNASLHWVKQYVTETLNLLRGNLKKKNSLFVDIAQTGGGEVNPISKIDYIIIF